MPEHLVTCHSAATVANQSETVETYLGTPDAAATAEVSCWRGRDVAIEVTREHGKNDRCIARPADLAAAEPLNTQCYNL